jgi:hypothetical protein
MSFDVKSIDVFEQQAKRLIKKYPSLKGELFSLIQELKKWPIQLWAVTATKYAFPSNPRGKVKAVVAG